MPYVIGVLVVVAVVVLYVVSYTANEKTKAPEGCALPADFKGCGSCSTNSSCSLHKKIEDINIKEINVK
jgi:hypothetical protein